MGDCCNLPSDKGYPESTNNLNKFIRKKTTHQKVGEGYEQILIKRRHLCSQQTYKKCSSSLVIREMHMKTTLRYNLTPVRMAIIKNPETTDAGEDVEK